MNEIPKRRLTSQLALLLGAIAAAACLSFIGLAVETPAASADNSRALSVSAADARYDGSPQRPALTVSANGAPLVRGTDYATAWRNNVNAGTGTVIVSGRGAYAGQRATATFRIACADVSETEVSGVSASYAYTGKAITPTPTIRIGAKELTPGRDYDLAYADNVKAGTARIIITGKRNLSGSRTVEFAITAAASSSGSSGTAGTASTSGTSGSSGSSGKAAASAPISLAKAKVSVKSAVYTGKAVKPAVTVTINGKKLAAKGNYTVTYANNKAAGTAKATITGKGPYTGKKTASFKIAKASIEKAAVADIGARYTTSLSKVTPGVTAKFNGKKLQAGKDYTLSYANNREPGTATVTLKGTGNFKGSKKVRFKLVNMGDDLARAACRLSYSRGVFYNYGKYPGTKKYLGLFYLAGKRYKYTGGRSCDVGMSTAIKWAGYDKGFPGGLSLQKPYLGYQASAAKTTRWTCVGAYKPGDISGSKLQPGDVLVSQRHIWMYVGHAIPKAVYAQYLKGTDADLGKPNGVWVSSHHGHANRNTLSASLAIGGESYSYTNAYGNSVRIYRCVKPSDTSLRAGKAVK